MAPSTGSGQAERSPGDRIVIALFALLLLAPAVLALTDHAGFDVAFIQNTELRHPFVAPPVTRGALATGGWERDVERQIADAFPMRRTLIETYDQVKFSGLRDSTSSLVIRGTNGWLYLGSAEREYLAGAPSDDAIAHLAAVYAARARWCAERGIHYVFLLAPNKSTIYPQYLPAGVARVTRTGADRLLPMLKARGVRVVDVRAALVEASRRGDVYTHADTHWNDAGAYLAYRAIVASLAFAGVRDTIAPLTIRQHVDAGDGDLLRLSGVAGRIQNQWRHFDFPRRARDVAPPAYANDPDLALYTPAATVVDDRSLPVAVAFGDSFMAQIQPFFAESFRRTVFMHQTTTLTAQFDRHALEAESPKVVIQEIVERNLVAGAQFKP